nr:unnamed protein product [Naegleria fowleri]
MIPSSQIDFINQQTPHVLNREVFAKYSQDNRKNRTTLDIEKVNIDIEICNHSPDQKQNYFNELLSRYTEGSNKSLSLEAFSGGRIWRLESLSVWDVAWLRCQIQKVVAKSMLVKLTSYSGHIAFRFAHAILSMFSRRLVSTDV